MTHPEPTRFADNTAKTVRIAALVLGGYHFLTLVSGFVGFLVQLVYSPVKGASSTGLVDFHSKAISSAIALLVCTKIIWLLAARWIYKNSDRLALKAESVDGDVKASAQARLNRPSRTRN